MTSLIIGLITATVVGVVLFVSAIIRITWNSGYTAGLRHRPLAILPKMVKAVEIHKNELNMAPNWSAQDSLHDISDLDD